MFASIKDYIMTHYKQLLASAAVGYVSANYGPLAGQKASAIFKCLGG
jgi:hypothetical protein